MTLTCDTCCPQALDCGVAGCVTLSEDVTGTVASVAVHGRVRVPVHGQGVEVASVEVWQALVAWGQLEDRCRGLAGESGAWLGVEAACTSGVDITRTCEKARGHVPGHYQTLTDITRGNNETT